MSVKLIWSTPDGENLIGYMARVSNSRATLGQDATRLIKYLIDHQHWSPFEMVNVCVQIECPRDISRQILRHRSFSFQEFSGRYSTYDDLLEVREPRLRDKTNRQNSLSFEDQGQHNKWNMLVSVLRNSALEAYRTALDLGIAPEVARVLLPEGLVPTRLYMNGTLRSWIHYVNIRTGPETQKEHRLIAEQVKEIITQLYPTVAEAAFNGSNSQ